MVRVWDENFELLIIAFIFAVGIGNRIDQNQLLEIAGLPDYKFNVATFDAIKGNIFNTQL